MTPNDTTRFPARGGHPTDEDLSALLDGEADVDAHVRRCPTCRARVAELRSASRAVTAPVALPRAALRDAAIARAVASATGPSTARRASARVVWLRRLQRPALAGGAVAAAVAAVVAFAVLPNRDKVVEGVAQSSLKKRPAVVNQNTAADSAATTESAGGGAPPGPRQASPAGGANGGMAFTVGGLGTGRTANDLGDVRDGAALRDRVGPAVQRRRAAGDEATTFAAPADSRSGQPQPAAAPAAPAAGGTAGNAASAPDEAPPAYSGPPPKCEGNARSLGPTTDRLVFVATARWQDTPAIVLAFVPEPPASGPARVYVMAEADCRLLFSDVYEQ
jgi:hypothetical protein